jgi:hypothetical protein
MDGLKLNLIMLVLGAGSASLKNCIFEDVVI